MNNEKKIMKNECLICSPKSKEIEGSHVIEDGKQNSNEYAQNYNIDFSEVICNLCKEKINAWGGSINYRTPVRAKTN
jgi:hypothetical protein